MRNKTTRRRRSAAQWSKLVATWRRSGQTAARFAASRGIEPRTFAWWRWHLTARSTERRPLAAAVPAPRLVAVELKTEGGDRDIPSDVAWELEDPRGIVLRVRTPISSADLERVLAAMTAQVDSP